MVLVALFGGGGGGEHRCEASASKPLHGRGGYSSIETRSLLASVWLPVSDSVLERGHLEDG